ncbi:MAG: hypothetical protein K9L28_03115 [Synergistales bacterium]|nr:hypothetical protein [Synergistales bacterium]
MAVIGGIFLCGGAAPASQPPYPLEVESDIFVESTALSGGFGQSDRLEITFSQNGATLAVGGVSLDVQALDRLLLRTTKADGSLTAHCTNAEPARSVDVYTEGDALDASETRFVSGDRTRELAVRWKAGDRAPGLGSGRIVISGDQAVTTVPLQLAFLEDPDVFQLEYASGTVSADPQAYRSLFVDPRSTTIDLSVMARADDVLWFRLFNWGTNVVEAGGSGLTDSGVVVRSGDTAASVTYPAYGQRLRTGPLGLSPRVTLEVEGQAGYDLDAAYRCYVDILSYSSFSRDMAIAGARLSPLEDLSLPASALEMTIPGELGTLTCDEVHPKYLHDVDHPFRALEFGIGAGNVDPDRVLTLPVLVSWTFSRRDVLGVYSDDAVPAFFEQVAQASDQLKTLFARVRPVKQLRISGAAHDLVDLAGDDWPSYFSGAMDPGSGAFTLHFRLIVVDSDSESVETLLHNGIGFFVVYDGDRNGVFADPLALDFAAREQDVPDRPRPTPCLSPTATPGATNTPTPTGGGGDDDDDGKDFGCSTGGAPFGALLLLPVLGVLAALRRTR